MFNPVSTYRIQFHKDFTFANLEQIIPYLAKLGVKTLYASPIFSAVPGSNHGYDGVDPLTINPEIGTLEQLKDISKKLKQVGISWLQDIVPNHMAFHHHNKWLMDLLKNGPSSPYRNYFDQSLADETFFKGPIMVPFLGDDLENVINNGELKIINQNDGFFFNYADQFWPINDDSALALTGIDPDVLNVDKSKLIEIANKQHYRLCNWKETDTQINFRRFFTVNGLICINIQRQKVFDHFHQLIAQLLKEDVIQGLRIDHIDGLYDPEQYLQRLRKLAGDDTYIVVEKILEPGEALPAWPIQGTTGYDFLAQVNNLFTDRKSEKAFTRFYKDLTEKKRPVNEQIKDKKNLILTTHMNGELENLTNLIIELGLGDANNRDGIKKDISHLLINFPVYRFYGNSWPLPHEEEQKLVTILNEIKSDNLQLFEHKADDDYNRRALSFYQRCMQFSGPLMAKGVEDTLMYTYNRFIDHNEVGDSPETFGLPADEFHTLMIERQNQWPLALNATATHDTKRGEGVRARLNVLSTISDEWIEKVTEWQALNADIKLGGAPDNNDEYFIYQTLIGTYPMPGEQAADFAERLDAYLEKTLREAKRHSNWADPNENYEEAVKHFASSLLNTSRPFWDSFKTFHKKVCDLGVVNSLAQLTLKLTCPGVPDIYQGCELWDLSMVDPDNRRPVDYSVRQAYLDANERESIEEIWGSKFNGHVKTWLLQRLLDLRSKFAEVFANGDYLPITLSGKHADEAIAFARIYQDKWLVTIVPVRAKAQLNDTYIHLPNEAPVSFKNIITNETGLTGKKIAISTMLKELPVAVLELNNSTSKRAAGVLLHITSLPSNFGIGDLGPKARQFAKLLKEGYQRYWQILPLNSVSAADAFSPYSSTSSQAGNILLISPEQLVEDGLLTSIDLQQYNGENRQLNFEKAQDIKNQLLEKAWQIYISHPTEALQKNFALFCEQEKTWLDNYAFFCVLKDKYHQAPWYTWPDEFKFRKQNALQQFAEVNTGEVEKVKWLQFIFTKQWLNLKAHCNNLGISIFGDIPFYISYDSADVWTEPELFDLDENLDMINVSGVPPDYFNSNGQRWGTPVYNWQKLKEQGYDWWLKRIKKNLQWFDLLRLDHFRAFADYWAVPANEDTAINGKWLNGPGSDFFKTLLAAIPNLPLVAEDLGDIDEKVHQLKDEFALPGMKVLQFAFGDNIAQSDYIPHHHTPNDIVYTGTHDNNTTLGWFRQDADKTVIKNLKRYAGIDVKERNIVNTIIRMALGSVCNTAIIPLQDWFKLDEQSRMNTPAGEDGTNWKWQLSESNFNNIPIKKMKKWAALFDRV
ncbi:malto-oligosyltrehalose synthase [Mucilaginibacter lutimaris]|uniref:4-alpha-glucanotransferase n=1 Tax=Mucilaginibacter lutimaris TaxID=931629 RepID=A0ABW2ZDU2_9SPHI